MLEVPASTTPERDHYPVASTTWNMDSNDPDGTQQVMKTMQRHPDLLHLSDFALECMAESPRPEPPFRRRAIDPSPLPSAHDVPVYEKFAYYYGIANEGETPHLLYRTGSDKYPFTRPGLGGFPVIKSLRGVYNTALNQVWDTVGPKIYELVKCAVGTRFSIDPVRFFTSDGDEKYGTLGPVVIWVAVFPKTTSAETAHEASQAILHLLNKYEVEDVEVEWREGVTFRLGGPALLPVVGSLDCTGRPRRHLTTALGIPIAATEMEYKDSQGTITCFFHENIDKDGNPSSKVFAVSTHHVLRHSDEEYTLKGPHAPRWSVRICGFRRFQEGLDEIRFSIQRKGFEAVRRTREIVKSLQKPSCAKEEEAGDSKLLASEQMHLRLETEAITSLEQLYNTIVGQWGDAQMRNIGHVHHCPRISADNADKHYTEDWGTIELDEAKFKDRFMGNVIDLGTEISKYEFTQMMYSQDASGMGFEYPEGRLLRIHGTATEELLAHPDLLDNEGNPGLTVLKDGCATGLTVGRYAGLESVLCDENGNRSVELAIYNFGQFGSFSARGDSGSLIVDGCGRMIGQLHSGQAKNNASSPYISYATPAWWLINRIKMKYPNADLHRTTW